MVAGNKLPIDTLNDGISAIDMAQLIFGSGTSVTGATYAGDPLSAGIYSNGTATSPGVTPGDTGIIMSTGFVDSFTNESGEANQLVNTSDDTAGLDFVPLYNTTAGIRTFDSSTLDVDFVPDSSVLTMDFVFTSEEYQEFENQIYQDFVGVWVNGERVLIEVGDGDIDPCNSNSSSYINLFVQIQTDDFNTEMDGLTITLSLTMNVNPGEVNSLRLAIADVFDPNYDSSVLVAANAAQSDLIANTDSVFVNPLEAKTVDVLANDLNDGPGSLSITQINGKDVVSGGTVVLPTGQSITLNDDGTLTVTADADAEEFNFTYTIFNGLDSDVGLVNATSVPCFVAGTLIATPDGEKRAECLAPGDLVLTRDHGPQPIRWIGTRCVTAKCKFAPIHISAGTFGAHRDLFVSPLHRVLIRHHMAELLFGEQEVLVAARDLVNDRSVQRRSGGDVTYVHLLFDQHQVVFSEQLETESFLPGPQTSASFDRDMVEEIYTLFPQIDPDTGHGYSAAARRTLKHYEATLLRDASAA